MTTPQSTSKWDLANWKKGKVKLFDALGLKGAVYPQLTPALSASIAAGTPAPGGGGTTTSGGNGGGTTPGPANGTTGGTGAANGCSAAQTAANQKLGLTLAAKYGWGSGSEWTAFNDLVMSESGWCNVAQNPSSTAYGIGQFLNTTWATLGATKTSDPTTQINLMLQYVKNRYGTPSAAWTFHKANNWY